LKHYNFSVVITTFNRPKLLLRAINSVRMQRRLGTEIEIVVIDDASTLPLPELEKDDLLLFRMPVNGGPGPGRMRGIELANAPWVLVLDDDDELLPESITDLQDALASNDFSNRAVIQFARSNGGLDWNFRDVTFDDYINKRIRGDFTPVFNKLIFQNSGLSFPKTKVGGEHLLWWRLALQDGIPSYAKPLVRLGVDADNRLTDVNTQIRRAREHQLLAEMTLSEFGEVLLSRYPDEYRQRCIARIVYALLSGERQQAWLYLKNLQASLKIKMCLYAICLLPSYLVRDLFKTYRNLQR